MKREDKIKREREKKIKYKILVVENRRSKIVSLLNSNSDIQTILHSTRYYIRDTPRTVAEIIRSSYIPTTNIQLKEEKVYIYQNNEIIIKYIFF